MRYGEKITALRLKQGMTRSQLARKAGVTEFHLKGIEDSRYLGKISLAVRIAKILGTSLDYLLGEEA